MESWLDAESRIEEGSDSPHGAAPQEEVFPVVEIFEMIDHQGQFFPLLDSEGDEVALRYSTACKIETADCKVWKETFEDRSCLQAAA